MRAGNAALQTEALRLKGQAFHMTRQRVIGFVAVHIHHQSALGGNLAQHLDAVRALTHRAFKVRNATHHIDSQVQCAFEVFNPAR